MTNLVCGKCRMTVFKFGTVILMMKSVILFLAEKMCLRWARGPQAGTESPSGWQEPAHSHRAPASSDHTMASESHIKTQPPLYLAFNFSLLLSYCLAKDFAKLCPVRPFIFHLPPAQSRGQIRQLRSAAASCHSFPPRLRVWVAACPSGLSLPSQWGPVSPSSAPPCPCNAALWGWTLSSWWNKSLKTGPRLATLHPSQSQASETGFGPSPTRWAHGLTEVVRGWPCPTSSRRYCKPGRCRWGVGLAAPGAALGEAGVWEGRCPL